MNDTGVSAQSLDIQNGLERKSVQKAFVPAQAPNMGPNMSPNMGAGDCSLSPARLPPRPARPPEPLLDDDCRPAGLPSLAALPVAPVILLDEHGGAPALLELLLLVVAAELALDEDGGLCHLFVKCILRGDERKQSSNNRSRTDVPLEPLGAAEENDFSPFPCHGLCFRSDHQRG